MPPDYRNKGGDLILVSTDMQLGCLEQVAIKEHKTNFNVE